MLKGLFKRIAWLAVLSGVGLIAAYFYIMQQIQQPLNIDSAIEFRVDKGQSAHSVLKHLQQKNVLSDVWVYKILLKLYPELAQFKAGTYDIQPNLQQKQVLDLLVSGKEKLFSISLVEGLRWSDWQGVLKQHQHLVYNTDTDNRLNALLSDLPGKQLEGWLLPDTYHFPSGANAFKVINLAYQQMRQYLEVQWDNRALNLPYSTPYESLIMASIIEKETGVAQERPRIAGVFVNRLNSNMRLQTDPTVIYGMGENFDGDIRRKDLSTPTPYNTYVIKGLPPTPIAMPSKLAIDAALNPLATEELYFVAKGDGSHQFSVSLKEHNQAVKRYQLKN